MTLWTIGGDFHPSVILAAFRPVWQWVAVRIRAVRITGRDEVCPVGAYLFCECKVGRLPWPAGRDAFAHRRKGVPQLRGVPCQLHIGIAKGASLFRQTRREAAKVVGPVARIRSGLRAVSAKVAVSHREAKTVAADLARQHTALEICVLIGDRPQGTKIIFIIQVAQAFFHYIIELLGAFKLFGRPNSKLVAHGTLANVDTVKVIHVCAKFVHVLCTGYMCDILAVAHHRARDSSRTKAKRQPIFQFEEFDRRDLAQLFRRDIRIEAEVLQVFDVVFVGGLHRQVVSAHPRKAGLVDASFDLSLRLWRCGKGSGLRCAAGLTADSDVVRITAKVGDVFAHPI